MAEGGQAEALSAPQAEVPAELRWVVHPLRHAPAKVAVLLVVVTASALLIGMNTGSFAWAALSVVFLVFGVYDFVFPTTYTLTAWGVESRVLLYRRRKPWGLFRAAYASAEGVLLSPLATRSFLEHYRGLTLRFAGNRAAVLAFVRGHLGAAAIASPRPMPAQEAS
jgi:hypothetical protein